jgi:hypothetical protein
MSVLITLPLFYKPAYEFGEDTEVTGDNVRALGKNLAERLNFIADVLDKLQGAGWDGQVTLYDIMLSHPFLRTMDEARAQLNGLGIDPEQVNLDEIEDEDEEEEDLEFEEGEETEGEQG